MGKINTGRMILGGIVAGVVIGIVDWVGHGLILGEAWAREMARFGMEPPSGNQIALLLLRDLVAGIALAWVYAAIRPRFGPGPGTASKAALAVWVIGPALASFDHAVTGFHSTRMMLAAWLVALVAVLLAGWTAGYLYQEEPAGGGTAGV